MPQPDGREQIVAGPLAHVTVAYKNPSFIADQVFTLLDVGPKAKIWVYQKGAWFRDEAGYRAPGTDAPRGGYPLTSIPLATKEVSFGKEVTDEDRAAVSYPGSPPLKPDSDALEFCSNKIDLRREIICANSILGSSVVWSDLTGGEDAEGGWAAGDSNTFITDLEYRIEYIRSHTGIRPTHLMLSANNLPQLKQEDTLLDRIKYTTRGIITPELIGALFNLTVVIGDAIKSTAVEKLDGTDFTASNIWERTATKGSAFLYYKPPAPALKMPAAGYACRLTYPNGQKRRVTTWREPSRHQDVYEVAEELQMKQIATDMGFVWYDTILT